MHFSSLHFFRRVLPASGPLALGLFFAPLAQAQSLLSHYSFDAGTITTSGSNITSASGTGNTLTPLGTNPTVDASGKFGGAANFSSGTGLNTVTFGGGGVSSLGTAFSISFWMKTSNVEQLSNSYVFQIGASSGEPQNAVLFGYAAGKTELYSSTSGVTPIGANLRAVSAITLTSALNNTWFNIVYTYDGSHLKGFLNGAEVFSVFGNFNLTAAGGLSVGSARNGAGAVPGSLDDFALWNGALSQAQIDGLQLASASSLSAIPEPSTYAAIGGGCVLGFALWRRRRSRAVEAA